ncbi:hypothetical protein, partial [Escherichia coli]|uniref:hypothetical protein n=1 Tax=Escherichia coli TaxID=562 RepID=UPI00289AB140
TLCTVFEDQKNENVLSLTACTGVINCHSMNTDRVKNRTCASTLTSVHTNIVLEILFECFVSEGYKNNKNRQCGISLL